MLRYLAVVFVLVGLQVQSLHMGRQARVRHLQWKESGLCRNCVALFQTHLLIYLVQLQSPKAMSGTA